MSIINHCLAAGLKPDGPDWPVVSLQRWSERAEEDQKASSVSSSGPLGFRGLALLRLGLTGLDGRVVQ